MSIMPPRRGPSSGVSSSSQWRRLSSFTQGHDKLEAPKARGYTLKGKVNSQHRNDAHNGTNFGASRENKLRPKNFEGSNEWGREGNEGAPNPERGDWKGKNYRDGNYSYERGSNNDVNHNHERTFQNRNHYNEPRGHWGNENRKRTFRDDQCPPRNYEFQGALENSYPMDERGNSNGRWSRLEGRSNRDGQERRNDYYYERGRSFPPESDRFYKAPREQYYSRQDQPRNPINERENSRRLYDTRRTEQERRFGAPNHMVREHEFETRDRGLYRRGNYDQRQNPRYQEGIRPSTERREQSENYRLGDNLQSGRTRHFVEKEETRRARSHFDGPTRPIAAQDGRVEYPPLKRQRQESHHPPSAIRSSSTGLLSTEMTKRVPKDMSTIQNCPNPSPMPSSFENDTNVNPKSEQKKETPKTEPMTTKSTGETKQPVTNPAQTQPKSIGAKPVLVKKSKALPSKVKSTNKLGIPMRWLKPKAKPLATKKAPEDSSKSKIPSKQDAIKNSSTTRRLPPLPSNRLVVTDSSEGGSSLNASNATSKKHDKSGSSIVPDAIVTKRRAKTKNHRNKVHDLGDEETESKIDEWNSDAESESEDSESSSDDDDEEEVLHWASKMLGIEASDSLAPIGTESKVSPLGANSITADEESGKIQNESKSPKIKISLSAAMKKQLSESIKSEKLSQEDCNRMQSALKKLERKKRKNEKLKALSQKVNNELHEFDQEKARLEIEEDRRKREEARPLTAKEIRRILKEDTTVSVDQSNWVRRSRRQPSMALLNSKPVRVLVDKLKNNDIDMRVLKMKKYINDPNAPCAVLDAILGAMEENTNCEALYIQNFNEGMRDQQVLHLLRILQQSSCNIWCLNIGENYNVSDETWEKFTKGLMHTKITHMYASEHTITTDMKDEIRFTIRENRKKHDMHINPNNLDVIVQCTHCWWNPINAKVLRPYLKNKGYEHILKDREAQGLQGTTSMAPTK